MDRRKFLLITSALGAGLIAGCGDTEDNASTPTATSRSPEPDPTDTPIDPHIRSEVASGLDVPWGIAFLASGDALVSMRETGDVVRVTAAGRSEERRVGKEWEPRAETGDREKKLYLSAGRRTHG